MSRIEAIIFDCDGVIFESRNANLSFYNKILEKFSYPLVEHDDKERSHLCHTASSADVLKGLLAEEDVEAALQYAAQIDYREFIPQMIPEPHLESVLKDLNGRYPLAIATNRGKSIEAILDHFSLRDYFSVVVTSRDVERPKPAPDMLLYASQQLNIKPQKCLFIGDSELDMEAAGKADVHFLGYGGSVSSEERLLSHAGLAAFLGRCGKLF